MGEWIKARLAARLAGDEAVIPTTDFYVLSAFAGMGETASPIRRVGPFTFTTGTGDLILVRHLTRADRTAIERARPRRLFYMVDDLVRGSALRASTLPADYVSRLESTGDDVDWIVRRDPVIVAPNREVAGQFGAARTVIIPPSLQRSCETFSHFDSLARRPRIACFGTRSHLADLDAISPALEALSRRRPDIEISTFLGRHLPGRLKRLETVRNRRPLPWPFFKRVLRSERFHVALAPGLDTPFNRARSITKLLDHAAVGAAGVYSDRMPYAGVVSPGMDGCLAGDDPDEWLATIEALIDRPEEARRIAENGVALARRIGDPAAARALWVRALGSDIMHVPG